VAGGAETEAIGYLLPDLAKFFISGELVRAIWGGLCTLLTAWAILPGGVNRNLFRVTPMGLIRPSGSICDWVFVDGVDDESCDGNFLRLEKKACCLFEGYVEDGEGVAGVGCGLVAEFDVIVSGDAGLIDYGEASRRGEVFCQLKHGPVGSAHLAGADVDAEAGEVISFSRCEVRAALGDDESVSAVVIAFRCER